MSLSSLKRAVRIAVIVFLCFYAAGMAAWAKPSQTESVKSVQPTVRSSPIFRPAMDSLDNGVPLQTSMDALTYGNIYIDVPAGATKLTVTVSGGSGDLDLYIKYGAPLEGHTVPELDADTDYISEGPTPSEQVVVTTAGNPPLQQGKWYVAVLNYNSYKTGFTLTATYEVPETGMENGVPLNYALESRRFLQNLFIDVPSEAHRLTIFLADGTGDLDLYIKHGSDVTGSTLDELKADADFYSGTAGTDEIIVISETTTPPLGSGKWYIAVGNRNDSAVNLTITALYQTASGDTQALTEVSFQVGDPFLVPWGRVRLACIISSVLPNLKTDLYVALLDHNAATLVFLRQNLPATLAPEPFTKNVAVSGQELLLLELELPESLLEARYTLYSALLKPGAPLVDASFLSDIAVQELFLGTLSGVQMEALALRGNPSVLSIVFQHNSRQRIETWLYGATVTYTFENGRLVSGPGEDARMDASAGKQEPVAVGPGLFQPGTSEAQLTAFFGEPDHILQPGPLNRFTWYYDDAGLSVTLENGKILQIGMK